MFCQKDQHINQKILGICLNSNCAEGVPEFCFLCLRSGHKNCKKEIFQFNQLDQPLKMILKNLEEYKEKLNKDYENYKIQYEKQIFDYGILKEKFKTCLESIQNQQYEIIFKEKLQIKLALMKVKQQEQDKPLRKGLNLMKESQWQQAAEILSQEADKYDLEFSQFLKYWSLAQINQFSEENKYIEQSEHLSQALYSNLKTVLKKNLDESQINPIFLIINGIMLDFERDYINADKYYNEALKIDQNNIYCLYWKSLALIKLGKYEEAQIVIKKSRQINNTYYLCNIAEGHLLYEQKKFQEALLCFEQAISINSKYSSAYLLKGKTLTILYQLELAIKQFKIVISIDSKNIEAYFSLGNALELSDEFEEAIMYYDQVLILDQAQTQAYYKKAIALNQLKRYVEAHEHFIKAIQLDQNNSKIDEIYFQMGMNLKQLGKFEDAITCFKKTYSLNNTEKRALQNIALCLKLMNKIEEAIEIYDQMLSQDIKDKEAYYQKGLCLQNKKKHPQAIECFQILINLDVAYQNVQYLTGLSHISISQFNDAIFCFNQAITQNRETKNSHFQKGLALNKLKNQNEALDSFSSALNIDKNDINLIIAIANTLRKLGQFNKAMKYYDLAIKIQNQQILGQFTPRSNFSNQQWMSLSNLNELQNQSQSEIQRKISDQRVVKIHINKGQTLLSLKQFDQAQIQFDQALIIESQNILALTFKGLSLCKQKNPEEGLKYFNQVLKLNPKYILASVIKDIYQQQNQINIAEMKSKLDEMVRVKKKPLKVQLQIISIKDEFDQLNQQQENCLEKLIPLLKKLNKFLQN